MGELEELLLSRIKKVKGAPVSSKTIQQITNNELRKGKS